MWPSRWSGPVWLLALITCLFSIPIQLLIDAAARASSRKMCSKSCCTAASLLVKRCALEAGLAPMHFAGHAIRSGLATAAAKAGKSERSIMKQTGHRSVSVVRRYIRDAELFDDNAAGIGL